MTPLRSVDQIKQLSRNFVLWLVKPKDFIYQNFWYSLSMKILIQRDTLSPKYLRNSKQMAYAWNLEQASLSIASLEMDVMAFTKDELDWEKLSLDIQRSSESIFPENGDRREQISKYLTLSDSKGLAMGFHTEGDFCLGLWEIS